MYTVKSREFGKPAKNKCKENVLTRRKVLHNTPVTARNCDIIGDSTTHDSALNALNRDLYSERRQRRCLLFVDDSQTQLDCDSGSARTWNFSLFRKKRFLRRAAHAPHSSFQLFKESTTAVRRRKCGTGTRTSSVPSVFADVFCFFSDFFQISCETPNTSGDTYRSGWARRVLILGFLGCSQGEFSHLLRAEETLGDAICTCPG